MPELSADLLNIDSRYLLKMFASLSADSLQGNTATINSKRNRLSKHDIDSLVANNILNRAVYAYPQTGWFTLSLAKETKNIKALDIMKYLESLPVYTELKNAPTTFSLRQAFKLVSGLSRKYGSAYLLFGVADGKDLKEPLELSNVISLEWLRVYSAYELFYEPYTSTTNESFKTLNNTEIHPSRLLEFTGNYIDDLDTFASNNYMHESCIDSLFSAYSEWCIGNQAVSEMLQSANFFKFGLDDLGRLVKADTDTNSTKNQDYLKNRARSLSLGKSVSKLFFYDRKYEQLENVSRNFGGVKESVEILKDTFAAALDMPRWKVFNEFGSPNGLANSVESARILSYQWAFMVQDWQVDNWLTPIVKSVEIAMICLTGNVIDEFSVDSITFPFQLKLTDLEKLELEKVAVERAKVLLDAGAISVEEMRSMYRNSSFNPTITLLGN